MRDLLDRYESFCSAMTQIHGFHVTLTPRTASTASDIAALERFLGGPVPSDLSAFWRSSAPSLTLRDGEDGLATDELLDAVGALAAARLARARATKLDADDPVHGWCTTGIPLQSGDVYCFVDAEGAVRQMHPNAMLVDPIAPTFRKFFELWLDSGCWSSRGDDPAAFDGYWANVAHLMPKGATPPSDNLWLQHRVGFASEDRGEQRVILFELGTVPKSLAALARAVCFLALDHVGVAEALSVVPERALGERHIDAMMKAIERYLDVHDLHARIDPEENGTTLGFHPDLDVAHARQILTDAGFAVDHFMPSG